MSAILRLSANVSAMQCWQDLVSTLLGFQSKYNFSIYFASLKTVDIMLEIM